MITSLSRLLSSSLTEENLEGFIEVSTRKSFRASGDKTVEPGGLKLSQRWTLERPYCVLLDCSRCFAWNNWAVECSDASCKKVSFQVGLCCCLITCLSKSDTKSHLIHCMICAALTNGRPPSQWTSDIQHRNVHSVYLVSSLLWKGQHCNMTAAACTFH